MVTMPANDRAPVFADRGTAAPICMFLVMADVLLHKVCVPGLPALPLMTAILPACAGLALITGVLRIEMRAFIAFLIFAACAAISMALSVSTEVSITSLMLTLVALAPFALVSCSDDPDIGDRVLRFASNFFLLIAVIGIFQLVLQSVIDREILYFMDYQLPESIALQGYNNFNPLYWNSPYLKSTGVFFAEPSYFAQMIALAIIIELTRQVRIWRLAILTLAMICSYSGTGLLMLGIWGIYFAIFKGRLGTLIIGAAAIGIPVALFGSALGLDIILARSQEFSETDSSGFARFISIFIIIREIILPDPLYILFGRGPGTVMEYFWKFSFKSFDPTWGKLFYEYGVVGSLAFLNFYWVMIRRQGGPLVIPVTALYFLMGGYLVDASIIALMVALVVWLPPVPETEIARLRFVGVSRGVDPDAENLLPKHDQATP